MLLYYSQNSPFARVARVAAIECGLADDIETVEVVNRSPDSPLLRHSPVCRVPTLVDGELVLGEARNICTYFDHLTGRTGTLVASGPDWRRLGFESMALGFLDGAAVWVRENRRRAEEKSQLILDIEKNRAGRCLTHFEAVLADRSGCLMAWDFGGIAVACAIAILELNALADGWRTTRPQLADWYARNADVPSMHATRPR